jgi:hydrogenase/urease accessory protein HupE
MRILLLILMMTAASPALGHTFAPSLLELRQQDDMVLVRFKQPAVRVMGSSLRPVLPESCQPVDTPSMEREGTGVVTSWRITCGELVGETIGVEGIASSRAEVLLRLELSDNRAIHRILTADAPVFKVPAATSLFDVVALYGRLGVQHILSGFDHLLFVLGLVILVRDRRSLAATVTAFTAGHSVTLALAALGVVRVPPGPTEAAIALSIFVLAVELARPKEDTWLRRSPWLVAALFGLLHGLGFAGALSEIGLPPPEIPAALFAFNIGIELGQLAFVGVVLAVGVMLRWLPDHRVASLSQIPIYLIGSLAAFWSLERLSDLW